MSGIFVSIWGLLVGWVIWTILIGSMDGNGEGSVVAFLAISDGGRSSSVDGIIAIPTAISPYWLESSEGCLICCYH